MDSSKTPAKAPIEPALRGLAERQRRDLGPHLAAEELVAYHERRYAAGDVERVRDHLALCPECAGRLLDLDAFSEPSPAGAPDLTTAEVEAAWRELAPRLTAAPPPVAKFPARPASPAIRWRALAAALFVGVVGLSLWLLALRGELRARSQPQMGVVVADLLPEAEAATRGGLETTRTPFSHPITLVLHPPAGTGSYAAFDLEIRQPGPRGRVLSHLRGAQPTGRLGTFPIGVPAGFLAPGEYVVRLYGTSVGKRVALADYDLLITER